MYIKDSIKMTLPTGLNEGSGLMDVLDEESIKIMKVMYLISKRHDVHVTIDGDKEKDNMKEELEQIRYNMVCSNNLYCTDRPDLLNENNKDELLFETNLNESIKLIDEIIDEVEVNLEEYEEFKKEEKLFLDTIGEYNKMKTKYDNMKKELCDFRKEYNESLKENKKLNEKLQKILLKY